MWAQRPYSFSAATQLELASLAISLAISHHATTPCDDAAPLDRVVHDGARYGTGDGARHERRGAVAMLDPCCGSGTLLLAAALQGLRAVGCDLNPTAVTGATRNLEYASGHVAWAAAEAPSVHLQEGGS